MGRAMTRSLGPIALAIVLLGLVAGGFAVANQGRHGGEPIGPGPTTVVLTIRHSRFAPDHLDVRTGTDVRFVIHNDDPIGHEFIIGDDGVHQRHERGTEPVHPPRPGEVSIAAGTTAETTFRFEGSSGSGTVVYACHLPGHFRFGMSGTVDVVAA